MIRPGVKRLFRLALGRRDVVREHVDDEIALHLELRARALEAQGLTPDEARREAQHRFGDTPAVRRSLRATAQQRESGMRLREWLDGWGHDLRFTARQLAKARGFTAIAVLTLALGIGANTAIFSVVHHLLIAPLPYPDGNSIVQLRWTGSGGQISTPADSEVFNAWRAQSKTLEDFAGAVQPWYRLGDTLQRADSVPGALVTPGFFRLLRVRPVFGRAFVPGDTARGAPPVAMIDASLWHRAYGGRSDVIGRTILLNGRPHTIVGVAPPGVVVPMSGEPPREVFVPLSLDSASNVPAFARLRSGVPPRRASAELLAIMRRLPDAAKYTKIGIGAEAMRAQDFIGVRETQTVKVLFAAVGALLFIACANVANLLLARGWTRRREMALRTALGATRVRLVRQVLAESLVLSAAACAIGIGIAVLGLHVIIALRPSALDNLASVRLQPAVLLWSVAIALVSGLGFGIAPALLARTAAPGDVLRSGSRTSAGGWASGRVRGAFVVLEVGLSLVMLVGAGLLVRSFVHLARHPLGFDAAQLYEVAPMPRRVNDGRAPQRRGGSDQSAATAEGRELLTRLATAPGVMASHPGSVPGSGYWGFGTVEVDGSSGPTPTDVKSALVTLASPGYFHFLKIPILAGRDLDSAAAAGSSANVVIGEGLAHRLWGERSPLGLRFRLNDKQPWLTVVGVVPDVHYPGYTAEVYQNQAYETLRAEDGAGNLLVRTSDSALVASTARRLAAAEPALGAPYMVSVAEAVEYGLAPERFAMALIGVLALVALVLSAVGLYGVIAYAVTHRTREIGIRVALGADPARVSRLVLGEGLRLTALGLVIGLVGAAFSTRALKALLFGLNPLDPVTFVAIAALLVVTTLVAAYVPARRAMRIDPIDALRAE
jgi:putative ABC transport system permease protein